jgi:predicted DCC family thiol-disulfide oxidoreductase YuxK
MNQELILFYDAGCSLCASEITHLKKLDKHQKIAFENIHASDFTEHFPHICQQEADRMLHGQLPDGEVIYGLDVTYLAWALVGKRHWVAILRWPIVSVIDKGLYLIFARYRQRISALITSESACDPRIRQRKIQ